MPGISIRGRSASSRNRNRSRRSPKCRTGRRSVFAGGARSIASPAPKGRNGSGPNGGRTTPISSPAIISGSRTLPATASGFSAKACSAAKRAPRAGTCTGSSHEPGSALGGALLLALRDPAERFVHPRLPAAAGLAEMVERVAVDPDCQLRLGRALLRPPPARLREFVDVREDLARWAHTGELFIRERRKIHGVPIRLADMGWFSNGSHSGVFPCHSLF